MGNKIKLYVHKNGKIQMGNKTLKIYSYSRKKSVAKVLLIKIQAAPLQACALLNVLLIEQTNATD